MKEDTRYVLTVFLLQSGTLMCTAHVYGLLYLQRISIQNKSFSWLNLIILFHHLFYNLYFYNLLQNMQPTWVDEQTARTILYWENWHEGPKNTIMLKHHCNLSKSILFYRYFDDDSSVCLLSYLGNFKFTRITIIRLNVLFM